MTESRRIDRPEPGFWAVRLVRGGPEIAAAIIRDIILHEGDEPDARPERDVLCGYIGGDIVALHDVWERKGRPITEVEYRGLVATHRRARQYSLDLPEAWPERKVDVTDLDPIF